MRVSFLLLTILPSVLVIEVWKGSTESLEETEDLTEKSREKEHASTKEPHTTCTKDTQEKFLSATTTFTFKYFYEAVKANNNGGNIISSPLATMYLYALLALYSKGKTQKLLLDAFNVQSSEQVTCSLQPITESIKADVKAIDLTITGSYFIANSSFQFTDSFEKDMKEIVVGRLENVNFNDPLCAACKIDSIVQRDIGVTPITSENFYLIKKDTELLLLSSFTVTLKFMDAFDNTETGPFHTTLLKTINVEYVSQTQNIKYAKYKPIKSQIAVLKLLGAYTIMIILPDPTTSVNSVLSKIANKPEIITSITQSLESKRVLVKIPNISSITTASDLKKNIESTQSKQYNAIFDKKAEFTNITLSDKPPKLGTAIEYFSQKFDYTGVSNSTNIEGHPDVELICNRPHIHVVFVKNSIFFVGVINSPQEVAKESDD